MRALSVYASASDEYTLQNNYLNNSETQVSVGCEFHVYPGASQTFIHGKIII